MFVKILFFPFPSVLITVRIVKKMFKRRFGLKDGKVTYQCRFLQSEMYKKIWTANRLIVTEFGTKALPDPCQTIFQRYFLLFDVSW